MYEECGVCDPPPRVTPVHSYSLSQLPDAILLRDLTALVARDRAVTAALLAHLAEVDARRLYAPAGHPSMYSYCVHEPRMSEEAAYKRIRSALAARRFPRLALRGPSSIQPCDGALRGGRRPPLSGPRNPPGAYAAGDGIVATKRGPRDSAPPMG